VLTVLHLDMWKDAFKIEYRFYSMQNLPMVHLDNEIHNYCWQWQNPPFSGPSQISNCRKPACHCQGCGI